MKRRLVLCSFLLLATPLLLAQTADEIIAKAIAARGGMEKLKSVQSLRITGQISFGGNQGTLIATWKRPKSFRQEVILGGKSVIRTTNGTDGWSVNPFEGTGEPQQLSAAEMETVSEQADFDKPLIDYKAKGNQVALLGKEKLEGSDVYKLQVTLKNGKVRTEYIDATTFQEASWQGKVGTGDQAVEFQTFFHDYRLVDGLMFAYLIETNTIGTEMHQKIVLDKVEVNLPLDDAIFGKPVVPPPPKPEAPKDNSSKPEPSM
jgi:hypothetical protein